MFDALIHRQDGNVTGAGETAVAEQALQAADDAVVAVGDAPNLVQEVRAGKVQPLLRDFGVLEVKERVGLVAEKLCNVCHSF